MGTKTSARKKALDYGVDITLLEENLKKTPTERVLALQNALAFATLLRKAGKEIEHAKDKEMIVQLKTIKEKLRS